MITSLMPIPKQQYFAIAGIPLVGGKIYTYAAGTTTPKETYTTADGSEKQPNPIPLNARGEPAKAIFWSGNYRVEIRDAIGNLIYTVDNYNTDPADIWDLKSDIFDSLAAPDGSELIGYSAPGIDTRKRTIYEKVSDRVSIKDYVIGDGVADDTVALNEFFSHKGNLVWDAGVVCRITSQILIPRSDFQLTAERGAKVVAAATMQSIFLAKDKNRVLIYGLEFDCANKTQIGIYYRAEADNPDGLDVFGCTLANSSADATLQYGLVCVDAVGGAGGTFKPSNIRVNGNRFRNAGTHGCLIAYCDRVEFCNNWVDTVANHGMEAVQCTNVTETGNKVRNCTLSGLGVGTFCKNFEIGSNIIDDCGGDASITVEHNCVQGSVHNNIVTNCRTTGLNVSFGTGSASPFDKVQRITLHDNFFQAAPGVITFAGANIYSSTSGSEGTAIHLHNNTFVGFNGGMTASYLKYCSFKDNIVTDLTGTNSFVAKLTYVTFSELSGWKCDSDTGDHAFQLLDYAGVSCNRVTIHDNYVLAASGATKNLVQIDGNGDHLIYANGTNGALHYINATGTASYKYGGNFGNIAGSPTSGGTANAW